MADPEGAFSPAPKIRVLRLTPEAYDAMFCGISPIPRDPVAELIVAIANALPKVKDGQKPVVGIDADITITRRTVADASTCIRAPQASNGPASPLTAPDCQSVVCDPSAEITPGNCLALVVDSPSFLTSPSRRSPNDASRVR